MEHRGELLRGDLFVGRQLIGEQGRCDGRHQLAGLRDSSADAQQSFEVVATENVLCWRRRRPVPCSQRVRGGWSCRMAGMGPFARVLVGSVPKTAFFTYVRVYRALCRRPLCVVSMVTISKACLLTVVSSWARVVSVIGRC